MFKLSATFGIRMGTATTIAGIIFWAACSGAGSSAVKAAVAAACGWGIAFLVMTAISVGCWYLVNKYVTKVRMANW
ncbi:MAG: hypothetical protein GX275_03095 [Clostridiales bacterium]|nr:hypothetical protein [Clostridiales bacterium]